MPSIPYRPDHCSYCFVECGVAILRRCTNCRNVMYCSRDCQVKAWSMHKAACRQVSRARELEKLGIPMTAFLGQTNPIYEVLQKWLAIWKPAVCDFAILALNLMDQPNITLTHNVLIYMDQRPDPPSPSQTLRMTKGSVLSTPELVACMRDMGSDEDSIEEFKRDRQYRNPDAIRVLITCEGLFRILLFGLTNPEANFKAIGAENFREASPTWASDFQARIEQGDASTSSYVTQNTTKSNRTGPKPGSVPE
ncbi:hypothetical protein EVG20_g3906 [Dentipellis fragilis]|uniref:MYND-type domain-containing protein n=1 Tax=Dentipellis fragilis TaxID=205917 RepID=A0A4Y9Z0N0_9AGAM|nr:hypothetical protein EVG20_g3906 [Dentipellis fragilis]